MRSRFQPFLCFLSLAALSGCPGANPTGNAPPADTADRIASLDHVQLMVDAITLDGDPAKSDQIAAMLRAMPEFAEVAVYDSNVLARFTDGEILVVFNNRPADLTDSGEADKLLSGISKARISDVVARSGKPGVEKTRGGAAALGKSNRIPASTTALTINAMGNSYRDSTDLFASWLSGAGYSATKLAGDVETLRNNITDVGVLYFSSHGAAIPSSLITTADAMITFPDDAETPPPSIPFPGSDGMDHFCLWTTTVITDATINQYRDEIQHGDLFYGIGQNNLTNGKPTHGRHFLITESFVRKHWKCGPDALLYIDACSSANSRLVNVCLGKTVGASGYLGWERPVFDIYSTPTARFFFDRTLGVNQYQPVRSPPQRPFSTLDTLAAMKNLARLNLALDTSTVPKGIFPIFVPEPGDPGFSHLVALFADGVSDVLLRPAITTMSIADVLNKLTVNGTFPDDAGSVSIGGMSLSLTGNGWTNNRIECSIPAGASGPVVVESSMRDSNTRRLTQWDMTFHETFMDFPTQTGIPCPACFYEATLHYTFRADVGMTRLAAEDNATPLNATGSPGFSSIEVTKAGGSYMQNGDAQYTVTIAPNPANTPHMIGTCVGFNPPADNNFVGACFFINSQAQSIAFSPTFISQSLLQNFASNGGSLNGSYPYSAVYSGNLLNLQLVLSLSPNFNIPAGQQVTFANSYYQWDAATATSPPDANDPN